MDDYFIRWNDSSPSDVREIPLGIYSGHSPAAAISRAGREWTLADDLLSAEPLLAAGTPRPSLPSAPGPLPV